MPKKHVKRIINEMHRKEIEEYATYLKSPWHILWANFLAGTARGLGFLLGATAILAIIGFILKDVLSNIPFIGDFFAAVNQWIIETLNGTTQVK